MKILYSEKSLKDLKGFSHPDRVLVVEKIKYLANNFDTLNNSKKVAELKGSEFKNQFRFVVAKKIRVLFRVEENLITLLVLRVGFRKDIYA